MKRLCIIFVLALALTGCGGGGGGEFTPVGPIADAGGGLVVNSTIKAATNDVYPVQVFLPASYDAGNDLMPAIYVTESDAPYGGISAAGPVSRFDTFKQAMQRRKTRAILVGIGGTERRNTDFLLPTAKNYLAFITRDLVPQVEIKYRADPRKRALSGLSHGGYFVFAALVTEATSASGVLSFSHYLSTESSFGGLPNGAALLDFEKELDVAARPLATTLLLAGATADGSTNGLLVKALYDQMAAHAHAGLTLHHLQLTTTHVGADVPAFEEALARYFP
jgi:hypothetical protein